MATCTKCGRQFAPQGPEKAAAIAGLALGDEYVETWFLCPACGVYTRRISRESFLGDTHERIDGPVDRARGDAMVELIRQCPDPLDKWCDCPAHKAYFS